MDAVESRNLRISADSPASIALPRDRQLEVANRARTIPTYRSLVWHWIKQAFRKPAASIHSPLPPVTGGQVGIRFGGHATICIRYDNLAIACDPMLGNWLKGIRRSIAPGLTPRDFLDTELILISHTHADHLHRPTLAQFPRSATVLVPPQAAHRVSRLGFARVVELRPGQSVQHRSVDISALPVRHGKKHSQTLAYMIRGNGPSVFFCGDSGYFPGFKKIGHLHRPDIAILPIGGYAPLSLRNQHMTPLDALYAFEDLQARTLIPIHYGSFALSYEHQTDPAHWLAELLREKALEQFVLCLQPGDSRVFVLPQPNLPASKQTHLITRANLPPHRSILSWTNEHIQ